MVFSSKFKLSMFVITMKHNWNILHMVMGVHVLYWSLKTCFSHSQWLGFMGV